LFAVDHVYRLQHSCIPSFSYT